MCSKKSNSIEYNFSGINKAFCLKNSGSKYFCNELCPDAICNKFLKKTDKKYSFDRKNKKPIDYNNIIKHKYKIIILLESPHKYEFFTNEKNPKRLYQPLPAEGKTGENLKNYFCKKILQKIKNYMKNRKYKIILVNPIQFQTSLGLDLSNKYYANKFIRDHNWERIWRSPCNDFISRLKHLISSNSKNTIILNLCTDPLTENKKRFDRSKEISRSIFNEFPEIILFEGSHPSSWERIIAENHNIKITKICCCDICK